MKTLSSSPELRKRTRMGNRKIFSGLFITLTIYILLLHHKQIAGALNTNLENVHNRLRNRALVRLSARPINQYNRIKSDLVDDDDFFDLNKRQTSDDYGHLRFGKRGEDQFDDYGHMRFGRNGITDQKK